MKKRIWPVLLSSTIGLVILLSLGLWQVQRLQWKERLIAELDKSIASDPVTEFANQPPFTKIKVSGTFASQPPLRMLSTYQSGPAWLLVQGFTTERGDKLLVIRGKQPHGAALPASAPQSMEIMGLTLDVPRQGFFDVANDVASNRWTTWDLPLMASQFDMADAALVSLLPKSPGTEGLVVEAPKAKLRNNHLGYAITWFGLAIVLIVMTALFVRARMKEG